MAKFRTHQEITWTEEKYPPVPRYVVCAANRYDDLIICGARHYDSVMCKVIEKFGGHEKFHKQFKSEDMEQGFIDQYGVFMSRDEAAFIVVANKQIVKEPEEAALEHLISEDLY